MQSYRTLGIVAACLLPAAALSFALLVSGRPPAAFGTILWGYECGFSVLDVERTARLGPRPARGTYYVVTTRVVCPFGERYHWDPARIVVTTNGCRTKYFAVGGGQALLRHRVLGAAETERLVFDLPRDVEQPSLLFVDTFGFSALVYRLLHGQLLTPHRFNIRYD